MQFKQHTWLLRCGYTLSVVYVDAAVRHTDAAVAAAVAAVRHTSYVDGHTRMRRELLTRMVRMNKTRLRSAGFTRGLYARDSSVHRTVHCTQDSCCTNHHVARARTHDSLRESSQDLSRGIGGIGCDFRLGYRLLQTCV